LIFIIGIWAGPTVKDWIWPKEKVEQTEIIEGINENVQLKTEDKQPSQIDQ
jgi:hypothetical protein